MNLINVKYILIGIALCIISYLIGWKSGKNSVKPITEVTYSMSPTIGDMFTNLNPIRLDIPSNSWIFHWKDTIKTSDTTYMVSEVDSMAILRDYLTKRYYNITLFDIDTLGVCSVNAITYKNKLDLIGYKFTPITKSIINTYQLPKYEVFGGLGYNTFNEMNIQLGIFKKSIGVSYQFTKNFDNKNNYHGLNVIYKFSINK